jgi:hypothetical protein
MIFRMEARGAKRDSARVCFRFVDAQLALSFVKKNGSKAVRREEEGKKKGRDEEKDVAVRWRRKRRR